MFCGFKNISLENFVVSEESLGDSEPKISIDKIKYG